MDQWLFLPSAGVEEAAAIRSLEQILTKIFLVPSGKRNDFTTKPGCKYKAVNTRKAANTRL